MGSLAKSISNVVFQDMTTRAAQSPQGQELFPDASRQFLESRGLQNQQPQAASISPIQVQTGAVQQTPQVVQDPREDDKRRQMIELLAKQGLDQRQIQTRLADLDDRKFFQSPAERVEETRKVPPRGLLSAGARETEEEEKQEKPRGILGI